MHAAPVTSDGLADFLDDPVEIIVSHGKRYEKHVSSDEERLHNPLECCPAIVITKIIRSSQDDVFRVISSKVSDA